MIITGFVWFIVHFIKRRIKKDRQSDVNELYYGLCIRAGSLLFLSGIAFTLCVFICREVVSCVGEIPNYLFLFMSIVLLVTVIISIKLGKRQKVENIYDIFVSEQTDDI